MNLDEMLRREYLEAMGICPWARRVVAATPACTPAEGGDSAPPPVFRIQDVHGEAAPEAAAGDWRDLEEAVRTCTKCALHKSRTQTVFGVGNHGAQWMFVGEAPGVEEDRQGKPFVGRAGQLLNAMIFAIGLKREEVYIANVLKCRPPDNRDPRPEEVEQCEPYLLRQIELINPRVIIALGRHAAHSLLKTDLPLGRLRARRLSYHGIPLVVTYHPAYLLRNPADKHKAWDDLCLARSIMEAA